MLAICITNVGYTWLKSEIERGHFFIYGYISTAVYLSLWGYNISVRCHNITLVNLTHSHALSREKMIHVDQTVAKL